MKKKPAEVVVKSTDTPKEDPRKPLTYEDGLEAARLNTFCEAAHYNTERGLPTMVMKATAMALVRLAQKRHKEIAPDSGSAEYNYWFKWECR